MNAPFESNEPYLLTVAARIGDAIYLFCKGKVGTHFYAEELRHFVAKTTGAGAPASADRILRQMRQKNIIGYTVVNRSKSLYKIDHVQQRPEKVTGPA